MSRNEKFKTVGASMPDKVTPHVSNQPVKRDHFVDKMDLNQEIKDDEVIRASPRNKVAVESVKSEEKLNKAEAFVKPNFTIK